jgi:uncharacterized protein (TIGR02117 family)
MLRPRSRSGDRDSSASAQAGEGLRWGARIRRVALRLTALVVVIPLLYLAAAFMGSIIPVDRDFTPAPAGEGVEVFMVSNGIHVDLLLPVRTPERDWSKIFPLHDFRGVDASWSHVLIGWGDRRFYLETPTWADLEAGTVLSAVFWPTSSVLHAQYVRGRPVPDASWRVTRISRERYRRLCAFIDASFVRGPQGTAIVLHGKNYGPSDNFYEGIGRYHAFNTCNLWTNRALKAAGIRTALWSPFPQGILWQAP